MARGAGGRGGIGTRGRRGECRARVRAGKDGGTERMRGGAGARQHCPGPSSGAGTHTGQGGRRGRAAGRPCSPRIALDHRKRGPRATTRAGRGMRCADGTCAPRWHAARAQALPQCIEGELALDHRKRGPRVTTRAGRGMCCADGTCAPRWYAARARRASACSRAAYDRGSGLGRLPKLAARIRHGGWVATSAPRWWRTAAGSGAGPLVARAARDRHDANTTLRRL